MTPPVFFVMAGAIIGALAFAWWRSWKRWSRLEALLERWTSHPATPPSPEQFDGEVGRLLRKIVDREESLTRDASDARFNLRAILASMEDGVLVADRQHRITFVNPALLQIFGVKGEPL